ncbi:MAG: hypothetical protein P1V97_05100, partial [Planctomycetota bacterium]|nr:hypothetical protein [Planctomycetota bacterium]
TKKGYIEESSGAATPSPAPKKVQAEKKQGSREDAIIKRLEKGDLKAKDWPLERVIWRAGVLGLKSFEAPLLEIFELPGLQPRMKYSVLWSLGRCGSNAARKTLDEFQKKQKVGTFLERMASEAVAFLTAASKQSAARNKGLDKLPSELKTLAKSGPSKKLIAALKKYYTPSKKSQVEVSDIDTLYFINNKHCRAGVLAFIQNAEVKAPQFQVFRHLWKIAEFRGDADILGALFRRIELARPMYRADSWYTWVQTVEGHRSFNSKKLEKEKQSKNPLIAFNDRTKAYFARRARRYLRQLAEMNDPHYIEVAAEILTTYTDEDAKSVRTGVHYNWSTNKTITRTYDRYAGYLILNDIIYGRSSRYELRKNNRAYVCIENYTPGDDAPVDREEAVPELWDRAPEVLLRIISESRCDVVQAFACKALAANTEFLSKLTLKQALTFLQSPYSATISFGLEVVRRIYKNSNPDKEILLCLANSSLKEAREQGLKWIKAARDFVLADQDMLLQLLTSPQKSARDCVITLIKSANWDFEVAASFVGQVLSVVAGLKDDCGEFAVDLGRLLTTCFASQLESLSENVFGDLLDHEQDEVQKLAADLMLASKNRLPGSVVFQKMISSEHESIRTAAIGLFGRFDDAILLSRVPLLLNLALHQWTDVRLAARPIIVNLAKKNKAFHAELSETLLAVLIANKASDTLAEFAATLLKTELNSALESLDPKTVWRLLRSNSSEAQDLGGQLLATHVSAADLTIAEIVALCKHEILSIRGAACVMLEKSVERARASMSDTIQVIYSDWDDARDFGFAYLKEHFDQKELTPEILVHLCDSVREDIQRFGQNLITQYFQEDHGAEYLVKLSEHPSTGVQLFVTNLLDRFAAGDLSKVKSLLPYFTRILSLVNRGRTAKQRVLAFLAEESLKSEDMAREIAPLLDRQSATMAIESKAATIAVMVQLRQKYPTIPLPIKIKAVPTRAVAEG